MRPQVCPYCCESFKTTELLFRCVNPDARRCPPEEDKALAAYEGTPSASVLSRVFSANGNTGESVATCSCGMRTSKRVCPHCHNTLPSEFGDLDSYTIALIGAADVGKSHYIAVLIHELIKRVGHRFNASLNALDDRTTKRYRETFRAPLYDRREVIPRTISARANIEVRYPLVYRLSVERKRFLLKRLKVTSLVFFDTAGEDLNELDVMSTETRYIANADGIIFLLDPLQIPAVRGQLSNSTALPSENTDPHEIIGRVAQLIRQSRQLRPTTKITTPVALAFSKIDAVRPLVEPGSPIHQGSAHDGFFNLTDSQRMNDSMRAYVSDWVGPELDMFLQHNFRTYSYFGVSALGAAPDQRGQLPMGVSPFRIEDPFLWVLYQLGVVAGRKGQ